VSGSDQCRKPEAFQEKRDFKLSPPGTGEIAPKPPLGAGASHGRAEHRGGRGSLAGEV